MQVQITREEYQNRIKNFIGLSIEKVNVLCDQNLFVGGFSLIHILDENKKQGLILSFDGRITYKNNNLTIETNINFKKNTTSAQQFQKSANQIKALILSNKSQINDIVFENDFSRAIITFSDEAQLIVETATTKNKPLSFDNDKEGYSIYFGEKISGDNILGYFRTSFK